MDMLLLFGGAFAQWLVTAAFTTFVVDRNPVASFAAVFVLQSLWWMNIQAVVRQKGWQGWLTWSSGAALGAAVGVWLWR